MRRRYPKWFKRASVRMNASMLFDILCLVQSLAILEGLQVDLE